MATAKSFGSRRCSIFGGSCSSGFSDLAARRRGSKVAEMKAAVNEVEDAAVLLALSMKAEKRLRR